MGEFVLLRGWQGRWRYRKCWSDFEEQTPLVRELPRIIRQQQDIIDQQQRKIERLEQEIRS
ncbi:MAG: hypothetical protein R3C59_08455 [Planctomycetaceae bacterium]